MPSFLKRVGYFTLAIVLSCSLISQAQAAGQTVNLTVAYKTVNFTGKPATAIAVNNQIPGPLLHFREGETVTINVYNHLDKPATIHWHGLLVPWRMDGVSHVSQIPIPPGGVYHYHFTLKQAGTYWYHAHEGLEEQRGLYGPIIIDPCTPSPYHYNRDAIMMLSDWRDTPPDNIYYNLKKSGDYYSPDFPLQPSLVQFIHDYRAAPTERARNEIVKTYEAMQHTRMGPYDISDVAYDTFLLNGHSPRNPWEGLVKVGDVVRLRFIAAGASTFFHIKMPGTLMQVVAVDGNDIRPYTIRTLTIAPAETYDVLVKITHNAPYIIYAESTDTKGAAIGALLTNPQQSVAYSSVKPFPVPSPIPINKIMAGMMMGGSGMSGMDNSTTGAAMSGMHGKSMTNTMTMPTNSDTPSALMPANAELTTGDTPSANLVALHKTNNPDKPVHIIRMVLSGYMDKYIWFINGKTEYNAQPIIIQHGQRYRLVFVNDSMMNHPMHIHGHWFILRNGHGAYDPLLHTVDVPPGKTVVVDFDANASGQWYFHCHNLYHMAAGMARVFRYSSFPQDLKMPVAADEGPSYEDLMEAGPANAALARNVLHPAGHYLANFLQFGEDPFNNGQELSWQSLWGTDFNKLELYTNDAEMDKGTLANADIDIFYWHLISQFWAIKGGANYVYRPGATPYWQPGIGIEGLTPWFIDTNVRAYYHDGSAKFDIDLSRDTQITRRFFITTEIRSIFATKTVAEDEIGSGLNEMQYSVMPFYQLTPALALFTQYEHDSLYGFARTSTQAEGEKNSTNTVRFGVSLLF